jgi:flagellum-specific peptidoglycan hydrolase FlgJ
MRYIHRPRTRLASKKNWRKVRTWAASLLLLALIAYWLIQTFHIDFKIHAYAPSIRQANAEAKPTGSKRMPVTVKEMSPQQRVDWELFKMQAKIISKVYDYPVNVLLAQAALESSHGTSQIAVDKNNWFGMNANDEDPYDDAFTYDNAIQSMIDYMQRIRKYYPDAYEARHNPEQMIELIKEDGYATDPEYVSKVMSMQEWQDK